MNSIYILELAEFMRKLTCNEQPAIVSVNFVKSPAYLWYIQENQKKEVMPLVKIADFALQRKNFCIVLKVPIQFTSSLEQQLHFLKSIRLLRNHIIG